MKLLFHTHTNYSKDCLTSISAFRRVCEKRNCTPIITDHNTIKGARAYQKAYGKKSCIIGEEIKTKQGEIIALYLKKEIKPFLDIEETMRQAHAQGAIIIVPHPFDRLRTSRLTADINKLHKKYPVHFIETFNSRTMFDRDNELAEEFFRKHKNKFLKIVGADAHWKGELKRCIMDVPDFDITSKKEFMKALSSPKVKFNEKKSPISVHVGTKIVKHLNLNRFTSRK